MLQILTQEEAQRIKQAIMILADEVESLHQKVFPQDDTDTTKSEIEKRLSFIPEIE